MSKCLNGKVVVVANHCNTISAFTFRALGWAGAAPGWRLLVQGRDHWIRAVDPPCLFRSAIPELIPRLIEDLRVGLGLHPVERGDQVGQIPLPALGSRTARQRCGFRAFSICC